MPIRADLRQFYGPVWRSETRPRILARAGNCCERCKAPNRKSVARVGGYWKLTGRGNPWHDPAGIIIPGVPTSDQPYRVIEIIIGVAHLNHMPGQDGDDNLAALCQYCHLMNDQEHHHQSRATRKDAARPLFQLLTQDTSL